MSNLLIVAATVLLFTPVQTQPKPYAKGDIVRLVPSAPREPLPDSRVIAVAGDRIRIDKSGIVVNGEPVRDVSSELVKQIAEPWDQVVPAGHYFVVGERHDGPESVVRYFGLIPAEKIVGKVDK